MLTSHSTPQLGQWDHLDYFLRPNAFVSLSEAGTSTPGTLCDVKQQIYYETRREESVCWGKRSCCSSLFFPLIISKAANTSSDLGRRECRLPRCLRAVHPRNGAGRLPMLTASLLLPSDVFPGWSSCLDETDDFLGPLLLTAGRSNSD